MEKPLKSVTQSVKSWKQMFEKKEQRGYYDLKPQTLQQGSKW